MKPIDIEVLHNQINQIEGFIPYCDVINTTVSKVNVAWHLDHSLKVMNAVLTTLQNSDPKLYKDNFSFLGKLFLTLRFFPRGKAKAPKYVMPSEIILIEDIKTQLAQAKENIKIISGLDKDAFFKHPMFGNVNKSRVVRFLDVHTNHHIKIIRSILK